jgi:hypothetical protein
VFYGMNCLPGPNVGIVGVIATREWISVSGQSVCLVLSSPGLATG